MGSILHTGAYSGRDPAFGHKMCRIMYNGPHYCDQLGYLICFGQSLVVELIW
jgi:hypothetical protein